MLNVAQPLCLFATRRALSRGVDFPMPMDCPDIPFSGSRPAPATAEQWARFSRWAIGLGSVAAKTADCEPAVLWLGAQARLSAKSQQAAKAAREAGERMDAATRQALVEHVCLALCEWKGERTRLVKSRSTPPSTDRDRGMAARAALCAMADWGWPVAGAQLPEAVRGRSYWEPDASLIAHCARAEERAAFGRLVGQAAGLDTMGLLSLALGKGWSKEALPLIERGVAEGLDFGPHGLPMTLLRALSDWSVGQPENEKALEALAAAGAPLGPDLYVCAIAPAKKGLLGALPFLAKNGADPNQLISNGQLPLSWALDRSSREACEGLLAIGANPTAREADGSTPLDRARNMQDHQVGFDDVWALFEGFEGRRQAQQEREAIDRELGRAREALGEASEALLDAGLLFGKDGQPLSRDGLIDLARKLAERPGVGARASARKSRL
jgi:hypothetical protein